MDSLAEKLFPKVFEALKKTQQPTAEERLAGLAALEAAVADLALQNLPAEVKTDA